MRQIFKLNALKSSLKPNYLCQESPISLLSIKNGLRTVNRRNFQSCIRSTWNPSYRGAHYSSYKHLRRSLYIDPVVNEALWNKAPVVALESTIITHGMPFPHNVR